MPRNNRDIDQKEKKQAIIESAGSVFAEKDFDSASMAAIAKGAGVTPNTIYWYFENKDDLLIAVLNQQMSKVMPEVMAMRTASPTQRILHMIDAVESPGALMNTVHARISRSDALRTWHDNFHRMIEQILVFEATQHGIVPAKAVSYSRLLVYVIEGLISHPHETESREETIDQMLALVGIQ